MTILLLTKSLSFEHEFIRKLNNLGHEVLCSKKFLTDLQLNNSFGMDLNYFDTLILSETISDQEVSKFLPFFLNFNCTIYRKTTNEIAIETSNKWKKLGITGFISQNIHFDELREELITCNTHRKALKWEETNATLENFLKKLSIQELKVFLVLQKSPNNFVSRESLSHELWGLPPTKSRQSRLSGIVRSIKKKMLDSGFDEECLETTWGRGYHLENLGTELVETRVAEDLRVVKS